MSADSSPLPDTLHAGYLRPRRRSVWGQERKDTEQLSGSSAVNATVRRKTIVGRQAIKPGTGLPHRCRVDSAGSAGKVKPPQHRVDHAHRKVRKPRTAIPPRRRLSFQGLLGKSAADDRPEVMVQDGFESRNRSRESLLAVEAKNADDRAFLVVHGDTSECGDVRKEMDSGLPRIADSEIHDAVSGIDESMVMDDSIVDEQMKADDPEAWLRFHATDLIQRIQAWAESLAKKEASLKTRMMLQDRRERRYRARIQS